MTSITIGGDPFGEDPFGGKHTLTDQQLLQFNSPTIQLSHCGQLTRRFCSSLLLVGSFLVTASNNILICSNGNPVKGPSTLSKWRTLTHLVPTKKPPESWRDSGFLPFSAGNDYTKISSISAYVTYKSWCSDLREWPTLWRTQKTKRDRSALSLLGMSLKLGPIRFSFSPFPIEFVREYLRRFLVIKVTKSNSF